MKDKNFARKQLLTKREQEVFELLVQDKTTRDIAKELFISEKTVRNHISNVMCKDYALVQNGRLLIGGHFCWKRCSAAFFNSTTAEKRML